MNILELRLNREKRGKSVHWVQQLLVDDCVLNVGCALDYFELARSCSVSGGYWVFTCGCSEPGCAGIWSPVEVQHFGKTVTWGVIDPKPERHFTFDAEQYRRAIETVLVRASKIVGRPNGDLPFGPYGFDREGLDASLAFFADELSPEN